MCVNYLQDLSSLSSCMVTFIRPEDTLTKVEPSKASRSHKFECFISGNMPCTPDGAWRSLAELVPNFQTSSNVHNSTSMLFVKTKLRPYPLREKVKLSPTSHPTLGCSLNNQSKLNLIIAKILFRFSLKVKHSCPCFVSYLLENILS